MVCDCVGQKVRARLISVVAAANIQRCNEVPDSEIAIWAPLPLPSWPQKSGVDGVSLS